ncbi:hypothetical protein KP509_23G085800 [Ceratopteris richardii]|nr:hypothetical protein KP509_23G085800 [Ceratopteris richardii]
MKPRMNGHNCDHLAAEKQARTEELMKKMPQMLFGYKLHRVLGFNQSQQSGLPICRLISTTSIDNMQDLDCRSEIKVLYEKFRDEVQGKRPVPREILCSILEQCNSKEDVKLAFKLLQELRVHRASKNRIKHNFKDHISALAVSASLRSKSYGLGLRALWKHNVYGLSPNLHNAHLFLSHAMKEKDMDLMRRTFETMLKNMIIPTTQTADILIRICRDNQEIELMFTLADEFLQNEIKLGSSVYDILISTAANFGDIEKCFKAQKWRENAGLDHTMASSFAIAKAYILKGEPQVAVDIVMKHCKDKARINKYLDMLVKSWPAELSGKKQDNLEEGVDNLLNLKENVQQFTEALSKQFRGVYADMEQYGMRGGKATRE